MSTVLAVDAPTVQDLIATIRTMDYISAVSGDNHSTEEVRVAGALAACILKNQLITDGRLPSMGVHMLILPYSEACIHLKIAGKRMWGVRAGLQTYSGVQLYTLDGQRFSFPITTGEAGWDMQ